MSQDTVSATAEKICRALLGDARKVDCDIIGSHIRELLGASVEASHPAVPEVPVCGHRNSLAAYDHVRCQDCGSVVTDGGWGIASRKRFKSLAEASFYKRNGRLPDEVMA